MFAADSHGFARERQTFGDSWCMRRQDDHGIDVLGIGSEQVAGGVDLVSATGV
jgi:hypothetical protein